MYEFKSEYMIPQAHLLRAIKARKIGLKKKMFGTKYDVFVSPFNQEKQQPSHINIEITKNFVTVRDWDTVLGYGETPYSIKEQTIEGLFEACQETIEFKQRKEARDKAKQDMKLLKKFLIDKVMESV